MTRRRHCEAVEKLLAEERKETAIKLLKDGALSDDEIIYICDLSLEQVRELRESLAETKPEQSEGEN